ncbi:hypothetical protein ISN45_Aa07g023540 [Arabidopsis thaliana x Arabidopsis arenosa]|uniref:Uncharacterized protein n=1 Tax=Arabidopsis thaliana x Arabidopsis arenosa TaxID=1240361 RepID=A0A8T1Y5G9_9BRAS|nr:hypothetical protein ISN45_Aa07g023540 [Arabidopsis thaliana x Arabidopsis arenosa]
MEMIICSHFPAKLNLARKKRRIEIKPLSLSTNSAYIKVVETQLSSSPTRVRSILVPSLASSEQSVSRMLNLAGVMPPCASSSHLPSVIWSNLSRGTYLVDVCLPPLMWSRPK